MCAFETDLLILLAPNTFKAVLKPWNVVKWGKKINLLY